jgi:hypothetical protein
MLKAINARAAGARWYHIGIVGRCEAGDRHHCHRVGDLHVHRGIVAVVVVSGDVHINPGVVLLVLFTEDYVDRGDRKPHFFLVRQGAGSAEGEGEGGCGRERKRKRRPDLVPPAWLRAGPGHARIGPGEGSAQPPIKTRGWLLRTKPPGLLAQLTGQRGDFVKVSHDFSHSAQTRVVAGLDRAHGGFSQYRWGFLQHVCYLIVAEFFHVAEHDDCPVGLFELVDAQEQETGLLPVAAPRLRIERRRCMKVVEKVTDAAPCGLKQRVPARSSASVFLVFAARNGGELAKKRAVPGECAAAQICLDQAGLEQILGLIRDTCEHQTKPVQPR